MRGRIAGKRLNGRSELRDGAFQISNGEQSLSRIGGEQRRLLIRLLLADFSALFGFGSGSLVVTELAKHRGQGSVRACKIRLQTDCLPQSIRRLGQFALLLQHRSERVKGLRVVGLRVDSRLQLFRRRREFSCSALRNSATASVSLSFNFSASPRS